MKNCKVSWKHGRLRTLLIESKKNLTFVSDFLNDDVGGFGGLAFAGSRTSEVVDHDRGTPRGQEQGIGAAKACDRIGNFWLRSEKKLNYILFFWFECHPLPK